RRRARPAPPAACPGDPRANRSTVARRLPQEGAVRAASSGFTRYFATVWLAGHVLCGGARADASVGVAMAPLCGPLDGVAASGRTIAVWTDATVAISRDQGATFHPAPPGAGRLWYLGGVAVDEDETVYMARAP